MNESVDLLKLVKRSWKFAELLLTNINSFAIDTKFLIKGALSVLIKFWATKLYSRTLGQHSILDKKVTFYEKRALFLKKWFQKFQHTAAPSRLTSVMADRFLQMTGQKIWNDLSNYME